ncbi:glucitol operon activator protein [Pseudoxanthobacter soli DSM 19599]|uniref:Glucitol operon activator protein n=1 Tax=Pseudoxanthobacter soli DSM 19599 TaxID=1123029 RepID=A0A1M7ZRB6_9HYPH|nr:transcriptional regulator GutM [Pseudoxanthobacter soli]SHO67359.1 glucitol operon activator protein [Pseudoxanthobacter soli DSM 19599]
MAYWQEALLLLAAVWVLQAYGTWRQMKHYRTMMRALSQEWPDGWMGAGNARGVLGKGVIALVVAAPNGTVRAVRLMEGRSVFAKFRPFDIGIGDRLDEFAARAEAMTGSAKGRGQALSKAIDQIRQAQSRQAEKQSQQPSTSYNPSPLETTTA